MNFDWNDDQRALLDALERVVAGHRTLEARRPQRFEYDAALQSQLRDTGLLDCTAIDELGVPAGVGAAMVLAGLPVCVEAVAAIFIAPQACPQVPGVCALAGERLDVPMRFLPQAACLVRLQPHAAQVAMLTPQDVQPVPSLFAYPMGVLRDPSALRWRPVLDAPPQALRERWRLGVAAELVGALQAALAAVVEHVTQRRQFGRPLGAFQGVQHRLAQTATAIEAARWLCLRAACSLAPADVALVLAHAQGMSTAACYDLHQFMGAMGLTLEHPLHRWTYRAKLLRAEFGGAAAHHAQAARATWASMEEMA